MNESWVYRGSKSVKAIIDIVSMMVVEKETGNTGRSFTTALRRNPKTSELIARDLVNYIVREGLPVGSMLPMEKDMVESYGVGRTTMREALRLLETRGVITIRSGPNGGPVVRRPSPADLGEALTLLLQFEHASLADVMEARQAFEPIMTRLAVKKITKETLEILQESVDSMLANLEDHEVFQFENQRFHGLIAESSGNKVLHLFNDTLKSIADGMVIGVDYTPNRRKAVALAHQRVVDALRGGSDDEAEEMMKLHLAEAARYWNRNYFELTSRPLHWIH